MEIHFGPVIFSCTEPTLIASPYIDDHPLSSCMYLSISVPSVLASLPFSHHFLAVSKWARSEDIFSGVLAPFVPPVGCPVKPEC